MLESYVVDKVNEYAKRKGWLPRKIKYEGRRGSPDWWYLGHGARLIIIEFKRPGKGVTGVSGNQRLEIKRLRDRDFETFVIDSIEEGKAIFDARN